MLLQAQGMGMCAHRRLLPSACEAVLLCFNLSTFTRARAEARGEEGLPLHSPGSEPDVQAETPMGFWGSTQELTPVVASAPAILHPHGWGRHEGMGAVPCLGTWEGER